MSMVYALSTHNCVKPDIQRYYDETFCWKETFPDRAPFFVKIERVYTGKTAWGLKAIVTVTYSVNFVLSKVIEELSANTFSGHGTLLTFLSVTISGTSTDAEDTDATLKQWPNPLSVILSLPDEPPSTSNRETRDMNLAVVCMAIRISLRPLQNISSEGFQDCIWRNPSTWY